MGYGVLFSAGLAVGLLSLVYYEGWMARQSVRAKAEAAAGDGGAAVGLTQAARSQAPGPWAPARSRLDGPAGSPPGARPPARAVDRGRDRPAQLRRGARHRAGGGEQRDRAGDAAGHRLRAAQRDRGFGIVAPLAADRDEEHGEGRPSWGFLLSMGDRRRPDIRRHLGRSRLHQRGGQRGLPDPGRGLDHLRHRPAAGHRRPRPAHRTWSPTDC